MAKALKRILLTLLVLIIILVGGFTAIGIYQADRFEAAAPLTQKTAEIESRADFVSYDQIAPMLLIATVAVEDARYYEHNAIDIIGIIRGIISQLIPDAPKSGGSSITQQTVKNMYGQYNAGLSWKPAEVVLAYRLEHQMSKQDILALYVNIINYGDNHHGIYEASTGYFGIDPLYLNDGQATILAGIPQSPANYQLSDHFEAARAKQLVVLDALVKNHYISEEQKNEIYSQSLYPY